MDSSSPVPTTASTSGMFLHDFVAVALDQASGDDEFLGRAGGFEAGHLEDGVDGLLLGGVDEAAGIDD